MKTLILALTLVAPLAHATSMHPCSPTVELMPDQMGCRTENAFYAIKIQTLRSRDIPMCQGKNSQEFSIATVEESDGKGKVLRTFQFTSGEFTYELGLPGVDRGSFDAPGLHLDNCVSPAHGGALSFGN